MKKLFLIICGLISMMVICPLLYAQAVADDECVEMTLPSIGVIDADNLTYGETPINKLDRGLLNTATFWTELPAEVAKVSREQNPLMGATVGVVQGTLTSLVRAGTGVVDSLTFFISPYDKPLMKPEYAFNRADKEFKALLW